MAGAIAFGCGQCLHCRINRSRQWQRRQILESLCHEASTFVTLTYNPECLPAGGQLRPSDVSLWLKRFRFAVHPVRVRFFLVGEYGSESYRPHYHVNLFGVSWVGVYNNKPLSDIVRDSWGRGFISVSEFNAKRAGYVSGYIVKHLKDRGDPKLVGRHAEFARMSRNPGLGTAAMRIFADSLWREESRSGVLSKTEDIPKQFRFDGSQKLLGRFLLGKLRKEVGYTDEYEKVVKDALSYEKSKEMLALYLADEAATSISQAYLNSVKQSLVNQERREAIFRKKESL